MLLKDFEKRENALASKVEEKQEEKTDMQNKANAYYFTDIIGIIVKHSCIWYITIFNNHLKCMKMANRFFIDFYCCVKNS